MVEARATGVTYDGGVTSLPYAVWHLGSILKWFATRKDAERYYQAAMAQVEGRYRERRRERGFNGYSQDATAYLSSTTFI